jgi:hypothetical protein
MVFLKLPVPPVLDRFVPNRNRDESNTCAEQSCPERRVIGVKPFQESILDHGWKQNKKGNQRRCRNVRDFPAKFTHVEEPERVEQSFSPAVAG